MAFRGFMAFRGLSWFRGFRGLRGLAGLGGLGRFGGLGFRADLGRGFNGLGPGGWWGCFGAQEVSSLSGCGFCALLESLTAQAYSLGGFVLAFCCRSRAYRLVVAQTHKLRNPKQIIT